MDARVFQRARVPIARAAASQLCAPQASGTRVADCAAPMPAVRHVSPEAATGESIAFLRNGDIASLNAIEGARESEQSNAELEARPPNWKSCAMHGGFGEIEKYARTLGFAKRVAATFPNSETRCHAAI